MTTATAAQLKGYYRLHAAIYDATRWSFLFGRERIIGDIAACSTPLKEILEVGCGTGKNLARLGLAYPNARLTGLDLSEDMLGLARKRLDRHGARLSWLQQAYDKPLAREVGFDLILFSYSLSMFNPGWEVAIGAAVQDLKPGGLLAVVDFESSPFSWFRRWMGVNHVRMEGHLLPFLEGRCLTRLRKVAPAYGGVWRYFCFVGEKKAGG